MSLRTIAIGDIHGCSQALRAIVEAVQPAAEDTLVLLGDYVDRGPDSRGVLEMVLELEQRCRVVPLLGNHELMLLDALENPRVIGPGWNAAAMRRCEATTGRLGNIPPEHLAFIRRCQKHFELPTHFFVHANYAADVPLDEQPDYLLFWEHLHFHIPARHENGKIAIVGHTAQKNGEVFDREHVVCIDTFCHGGGWLTAMEVGVGRVWQAARDGRMRLH